MKKINTMRVALATIFFCALFIFLAPQISHWLSKIETPALAAPQSTHSYTIPVIHTGTVYEAMTSFASSSTFSFTGKVHPELGFFIEEIGGVKNDNGTYWTLYINDMYSEKGASNTIVGPGDKVQWIFTKL